MAHKYEVDLELNYKNFMSELEKAQTSIDGVVDGVRLDVALDPKSIEKLKSQVQNLIDAGYFKDYEKMEQAIIEKKKMQYLYGGETYCFMDMETYDQVEIPEERLEWEKKFLLEGQIIEIVFYGSEILGVNLPEKISLEVTEASPAVAAGYALPLPLKPSNSWNHLLIPELYPVSFLQKHSIHQKAWKSQKLQPQSLFLPLLLLQPQ